MPPPIEDKMQELLTRRKAISSYRSLTTFPTTSIDFSSNDFLSLSRNPHVRSTYLQELTSHPPSSFRLGSTGSRLLDGNSPYTLSLEQTIAKFHNSEAALLFNSGFDANEGFFACVPQEGDVIVYDEFVHASVREGIKLCRVKEGKRRGFKHCDVGDLRRVLRSLKGEEEGKGRRTVWVAVESLYSMDGDLAPLKEILDVVEEELDRNGCVIVDEAHATGVYGPQGRGLVSALGLESRVFARLHTFGKALGCNGAAILCSPLTREYLINYARPLIYTTAMGFPSLAAIKIIYSLMMTGYTDPLRINLFKLTTHLFTLLQRLPSETRRYIQIPPTKPTSPIFSLITDNPRDLAKHCQERGYIVRAIMPPTVPVGTQRIRVCLHAGNRMKDVEGLVGVIGDWVGSRERESRGAGKVRRGDESRREIEGGRLEFVKALL